MRELRRKVLLPVFQLSELVSGSNPNAIERVIKQGKGHSALTYHYRLAHCDGAEQGFNYNLFPIVLDRYAAPWALGTIYLLSQLEGETAPNMKTYHGKADDLGAYKEWLDAQDNPDILIFDFPKHKLRRPTYRYHGHLQRQLQAGEISPTTAGRRMRTVIAFYRWLINNSHIEPEYPPWEEKRYGILFKSTYGNEIFKNVESTDVSIHAPKSEDPFAGTLQDGGKLRPLTGKEQMWILEATKAAGNTECFLIQLFMLSTGARIQTAGTLRLRHFTKSNIRYSKSLSGEGEIFKLKAGPGTGIDTKNNKRGVLQVPRPVYDLLHTYALSARSKIRRERFESKFGAHNNPYLFLTQQGNPYYLASSDSSRFNPDLNRRHEKTGQTIRQFLKDYVIPYVREHYSEYFHYRIHDLRASFGMNITESLLELVKKGTIPLSQARMIVKVLLWHENLSTTDLYLDYRNQIDQIYAAVNNFGEQLCTWTEQAMTGMEIADQTHE